MLNKHKYIFVYQTINEINGKSYVGVHSTDDLNDGYIGCGIYSQAHAKRNNIFHNAVRKYGYASFRRYILSFYDTYLEAVDEEKFIINEVWVKRKNNYNMALGGWGYMFAALSAEEISNKYTGEKNHRFGKPAHNRKPVIQYSLDGKFIKMFESVTEAANDVNDDPTNISNTCKGKYGQCNGFVFRYETYSEIDKASLDNNLLKRKREYRVDGSWSMSDEYKNTIRGKKGAMFGKKHSPESRHRMSLAKMGKKREPHSEQTKIKIGKANRDRFLKYKTMPKDGC